MRFSTRLLAIACLSGCQPAPHPEPQHPEAVAVPPGYAGLATAPLSEVSLKRSCKGSRLDLAWIDSRGQCRSQSTELAEPVVRLEPAQLSVSPGEQAWFELVLANDTERPGRSESATAT